MNKLNVEFLYFMQNSVVYSQWWVLSQNWWCRGVKELKYHWISIGLHSFDFCLFSGC